MPKAALSRILSFASLGLNPGNRARFFSAGLIILGVLFVSPHPLGSAAADSTPAGARATRSHRARPDSSSSDLMGSAFRRDRNGWIYLHLEGTPDQVGYQHGYLAAPEIKEVLRVFGEYLPHTTKHDWQFYRQAAHSMFWDKIGDEYQREIAGIARGAADHGVKVDQDDILALNAWIELAQYYVPSLQSRLADPELHQSPPPSCSAFIATGSWTRDGQIVIAHNNWIDYLIGRHWNVI